MLNFLSHFNVSPSSNPNEFISNICYSALIRSTNFQTNTVLSILWRILKFFFSLTVCCFYYCLHVIASGKHSNKMLNELNCFGPDELLQRVYSHCFVLFFSDWTQSNYIQQMNLSSRIAMMLNILQFSQPIESMHSPRSMTILIE